MMHPFPAEHDQQQAHALDALREAKAFILIHFKENEECDHPLCMVVHRHRKTRVIASCTHRDLHDAMEAIGEEIMITASIDTLMRLSPTQREQVAAMLREEEGAHFRLLDDEG